MLVKYIWKTLKTDCGLDKIQKESTETKIKNLFVENEKWYHEYQLNSNKLFELKSPRWFKNVTKLQKFFTKAWNISDYVTH